MLKVEYIPIADINPYKGNAKMHPLEQMSATKKGTASLTRLDNLRVSARAKKSVEQRGRRSKR